MHTNYHFLKPLVAALDQEITGLVLKACFSQNRDELIFQFAKGRREFTIQGILRPDLSILVFPPSFQRSRKNSARIFTEAIGHEVSKVVGFSNERCFLIDLDHLKLLFKMFGTQSNVILFKGDEPVALFKNQLAKDRNFNLSMIDRPLSQTFEDFERTHYDHRALFPTFGKVVELYLKSAGFDTLSPAGKWDMLQNVLRQFIQPKYYQVQLAKPTFSLLPFPDSIELDSHPISAVNEFYQNFSKVYYLGVEKAKILGKLEKIERKNFNYLDKTGKKLKAIKTAPNRSRIADIIMANLSTLRAGQSEAELFDFYNNRMLKISLNEKLTPQKNAEVLYRKAKNQNLELHNLNKNLDRRKNEQKVIRQHQAEIKNIQNIKDLRTYISANKLSQVVEREKVSLPYRAYSIDGYQIWVGKSARSNDLLLREFAVKDDLWLHAKDVAGSHVIVKHQSGRNYPQQVREKAAQLAAWNSKGKTNTLCPVMLTPRKYVRKPKGSQPGEVVVEKEQVILVEPNNLVGKPT